MTPEVQQRIFEPFFTTKPAGSGTGLGLALVHGIVRQGGGWIWVYSEPGVGTTFKIYFPATPETPAAPLEIPEKTETRGHETILVVEDQSEVRNLAVMVLERYGYRVLSACGGQEAIALASQFDGEIHLLLTDVVMPGMDGHTLAQHLTEIRSLRVLFMSGYTENAVAHRGILDAGLHYLQKPFTPDSLAQKIRAVLSEDPGS
jgi:CheY-like chemotaxis protein